MQMADAQRNRSRRHEIPHVADSGRSSGEVPVAEELHRNTDQSEEKESVMAAQCALIMINNLSRQGENSIDPVVRILKNKGIDSIIVCLDRMEDISRLINRYQKDIDRIVIGGGDGTLNAAVKPVLESGLPLGILPLGTANDLARTLGIPVGLEDAAEVLAGGRIGMIDIGVVNDIYFLNAASIGLAVGVTHMLDRGIKKRWGGLAYPIAFFKAFRYTRAFLVQISCDGVNHRHKSIHLTVANGRHYGRGLTVRDDAEIDDQKLHCYSLEPQSFWQLFKAAPSIVKGTFVNPENIKLFEGRRIDIITRRPKQIAIDGELMGQTPAYFSIKDRILPVFVPAETPPR